MCCFQCFSTFMCTFCTFSVFMCSIVLSRLLAFGLISCCIALNSQSHCSYKPPIVMLLLYLAAFSTLRWFLLEMVLYKWTYLNWIMYYPLSWWGCFILRVPINGLMGISNQVVFSCRKVVQSTREAIVTLQKRNPAIQPLLAILQVL